MGGAPKSSGGEYVDRRGEVHRVPLDPTPHPTGPIGESPHLAADHTERLARLEGEVKALKQQSEPGKAAPSKEPVLYTQAIAKLIDAVILYLGFGEGVIDPETAGLIVLVIEGLAVVVSRKAVTPNAKLPQVDEVVS